MGCDLEFRGRVCKLSNSESDVFGEWPDTLVRYVPLIASTFSDVSLSYVMLSLLIETVKV